MPSIRIQVEITTDKSLADTFEKILELENWQSFTGFGPIPGIASATFENPESAIVGRRILVVNKDGSNHIEEIKQWEPPNYIEMELGNFSAPLSSLATHFVERWSFSENDSTNRVVRSFELFPKNVLTYPLLLLISRFLRGAVSRHTKELVSG